FQLERKLEDVQQALPIAQGLSFEAIADAGDVTPGQTFVVTARVVNSGPREVALSSLRLQVAREWSVGGPLELPATLTAGAVVERKLSVSVPAGAPATGPYWRKREGSDRYDLEQAACETLPFCPPAVIAELHQTIAGQDVALTTPAQFRYEGRW